MKKTIAAILVVVIAGLASPGAFGRGHISSVPTGLKVKAAGEAQKNGDTVIDTIVGFFGTIGNGLRDLFSPKF
jgi:hypothetical protein